MTGIWSWLRTFQVTRAGGLHLFPTDHSAHHRFISARLGGRSWMRDQSIPPSEHARGRGRGSAATVAGDRLGRRDSNLGRPGSASLFGGAIGASRYGLAWCRHRPVHACLRVPDLVVSSLIMMVVMRLCQTRCLVVSTWCLFPQLLERATYGSQDGGAGSSLVRLPRTQPPGARW